jgi:hypothetical protein
MTYRLAIIDPPQADCFSFAALSAANENNVFLCDLCVSSEAPQGRDKRAVSEVLIEALPNKSRKSTL